jgi:hypothetical protein
MCMPHRDPTTTSDILLAYPRVCVHQAHTQVDPTGLRRDHGTQAAGHKEEGAPPP